MAGTQAVKAYLDILSQPCRAVLIFLKSNKIPHTVEQIVIRKGQQKSPAFTKLNPMQRVPVLDNNGFVLTERYIFVKKRESIYNAPDHWYPKLSQKRAQVDEYTAWHHGNTRMHISTIFLQEVRFPMLGVPTNPAKFEKALKELDGTLNMLENMFLKRQTFLCGEDISLADLLAVCELMQPMCGGRDVLKDRRKLQSWRSLPSDAGVKSYSEYSLNEEASLDHTHQSQTHRCFETKSLFLSPPDVYLPA
ncbi:glutathione S-transferase theta-3-like [Onychostoma macrolepis]|uniref:glutathione S-transferase theta-3-like n=1 Tax=Onychostoma macrolepis TaxID=369639 RepID=UPI00272C6BB6|nr:glutathione S-transferase theta-3-like [Onychostoma macrolepis]